MLDTESTEERARHAFSNSEWNVQLVTAGSSAPYAYQEIFALVLDVLDACRHARRKSRHRIEAFDA